MEFAKVANNERIPYCITAWASLNPGARKLKRNRKVLLDRLYTKKLIKNASGLHSIGKSETEEYLKLGAKNENIYNIDNGVVLQNFEIKEETKIFEKIGLTPKEQSYLLYLGRINEKKGIDLLLNAFVNVLKNHSELILVLAGFGDDSYIKEMKSLVVKLQIENNVKFTGFVTEQEKLQLYESAKIFALTSKDDIHPRAVQDALTMGVPVLITKNCDYPEVDEYDAGIIVEPNIHSITEGIENMLFSNEKLENQGKNAKNLIKERYLLSNQITKYEKMYQDILK